MLQANNISVGFGNFKALDAVNVRFEKGHITGIIGPNGAGKSTLLNVLGGTITPDAGDVVFQGTTLNKHAAHARTRLGLTRTFQISRELNGLTVLENLLLAAPVQSQTMTSALFNRKKIRLQEEQNIARARVLLEKINLWRLADEFAGNLSGGQKKLLELTRALMLEPDIVLLDEPAAGVNPVLIGELSEYILSLQEDGVSFGIIEHNMELISKLCDTVYVLAEGKVVVQGDFEEVVSHKDVAQAYLGAVN
jgi:ABC-type branched-subunit amino acid transport system ATPase component